MVVWDLAGNQVAIGRDEILMILLQLGWHEQAAERNHFEGVETDSNTIIEHIVAMGGGSQSDLWCQIIADVTGKTVQRASVLDATALDAGMIAAVGAGLFTDYQTALREMSSGTSNHFEPENQSNEAYSRLYDEVYCSIFVKNQPLMRIITAVTEK